MQKNKNDQIRQLIKNKSLSQTEMFFQYLNRYKTLIPKDTYQTWYDDIIAVTSGSVVIYDKLNDISVKYRDYDKIISSSNEEILSYSSSISNHKQDLEEWKDVINRNINLIYGNSGSLDYYTNIYKNEITSKLTSQLDKLTTINKKLFNNYESMTLETTNNKKFDVKYEYTRMVYGGKGEQPRPQNIVETVKTFSYLKDHYININRPNTDGSNNWKHIINNCNFKRQIYYTDITGSTYNVSKSKDDRKIANIDAYSSSTLNQEFFKNITVDKFKDVTQHIYTGLNETTNCWYISSKLYPKFTHSNIKQIRLVQNKEIYRQLYIEKTLDDAKYFLRQNVLKISYNFKDYFSQQSDSDSVWYITNSTNVIIIQIFDKDNPNNTSLYSYYPIQQGYNVLQIPINIQLMVSTSNNTTSTLKEYIYDNNTGNLSYTTPCVRVMYTVKQNSYFELYGYPIYFVRLVHAITDLSKQKFKIQTILKGYR